MPKDAMPDLPQQAGPHTDKRRAQSDRSLLRAVALRLHSVRIGDLLLGSGLISQEQLDRALNAQRQSKTPLGRILVATGALSPAQLYRALAEQWCLKLAAATLSFAVYIVTPGTARAENATARVAVAAYQAQPQAGRPMSDFSPAASARASAAIAPAAAPYAQPLTQTPAQVLPRSAERPGMRHPGGRGLFGSAEIRSSDISAFNKWTTVMARFEAQMATQTDTPRIQAWKATLRRLSTRPAAEQVAAVNDYINAVAYVEDSDNYGVSDHWATPVEFFSRGGDCEDFAIAKYASLRALGFRADQLRIAVVQDTVKNVAHAVLVVYTDEGTFVLDNQDKRTRTAEAVTRYKPIFSINSDAWWLHRDPATPGA